MLQGGHAARAQLPSLGHGGTGSYVDQHNYGNAANEATVPPPEQQAAEGTG